MRNTSSNADGYSNTHCNGNSYADRNGDAYCYCGAEVYADAKAASYWPTSTPISSSA